MKIIIPARGGSKRIPNKNIKDLNGKPLISYSIEASLDVTDDVYVSTDSEEIAEVASFFGAKVINRPCEISTDTSKTEETIIHFLNNIPDVDEFACVQPTTPMIKPSELREGFGLLTEYDSVISVKEMTEYLWSNSAKPINFQVGFRRRTQDMNRIYSETGGFYITTKKKFLRKNCLYNGKVGFVIMPKIACFEIDTEEDWELVSICMKEHEHDNLR